MALEKINLRVAKAPTRTCSIVVRKGTQRWNSSEAGISPNMAENGSICTGTIALVFCVRLKNPTAPMIYQLPIKNYFSEDSPAKPTLAPLSHISERSTLCL